MRGLSSDLFELKLKCADSERAEADCARMKRRSNYNRLARPVMTVNPEGVMAIPMPRNPAPVTSTSPIARPVGVIRPIAHIDTDGNGIRDAAHAKHYCKK